MLCLSYAWDLLLTRLSRVHGGATVLQFPGLRLLDQPSVKIDGSAYGLSRRWSRLIPAGARPSERAPMMATDGAEPSLTMRWDSRGVKLATCQ